MLFVDDRHIERSENVTLTLNPPAKAGACLSIDREWELSGAGADCIVKWQGEYWFYYKVSGGETGPYLALATSSDGITWEKPELGIVEFNGSTLNNLIPLDGQKPGEMCVMVDPTGPDEHRFKLVCHNAAEGGMYLMTSRDGLDFRRASGHLLNFITDNRMTFFFDERIGKYRIYLRGWDRSRGIPPMQGTRSVLLAELDDPFSPIPVDQDAPDKWHNSPKWNDLFEGGLRRMNRELPIALNCDDLDDPNAGLYQAAAVHYLPEVYLAFPTLYHSYPWPPVGKYINDGVLDLQFAYSRDGAQWSRDLRGSYVRLDLPGGPCSKQMHMLTGMVPNGPRISQYYCGSARTHGEGRTAKDVHVERVTRMGDPIAFRLEQRMDGFVSADSAYTGGELLTKPFVLQNARLCLNIDTSASGTARAALLDDEGTAIPGYGIEDCDTIQGNDTRYAVTWHGKDDLSALNGNRVRLLLRSRNTKLYAVRPVQVRPGNPESEMRDLIRLASSKPARPRYPASDRTRPRRSPGRTGTP